jgi:hypothetical protein
VSNKQINALVSSATLRTVDRELFWKRAVAESGKVAGELLSGIARGLASSSPEKTQQSGVAVLLSSITTQAKPPAPASKTTIRQDNRSAAPPPTGSPDSALRHAAGVDPNITGKAQAAFDAVMAKYAGAIEDAAKDPSLNPEQRAAAVASLRQRQQLEAAGERKKVMDAETQNARARRRNYRALHPKPKPN